MAEVKLLVHDKRQVATLEEVARRAVRNATPIEQAVAELGRVSSVEFAVRIVDCDSAEVAGQIFELAVSGHNSKGLRSARVRDGAHCVIGERECNLATVGVGQAESRLGGSESLHRH